MIIVVVPSEIKKCFLFSDVPQKGVKSCSGFMDSHIGVESLINLWKCHDDFLQFEVFSSNYLQPPAAPVLLTGSGG